MRLMLRLFVVSSVAIAAWALAQTVDPTKSSITIVFTQMNVPVDAQFKKFTATLNFDPAKPADARALLDIDIASFDLGPGAEEYNAEVKKKEWFDVKQFPRAVFQADAGMKPTGANKFDVPGKLTIKGATQNVVAPVVVKKDGTATVFEGQLPIKRLAFNIGEGDWKATDTLADEVIIKFRILAKP